MKKIAFYIVFIFFLGIPKIACSQQDQAEVAPKIKVLARNKKTQVNLRWAPNTPSTWLKLNKHGYEVERITVKKDGKLMPPSYDKKVLATIKPKPLEDWKAIANKNTYAAMIAQLLYGEKKNMPASNPIENMFNLKKDLDNRFSFILLASDMNFEAATFAGLGYVDTDIKQNTVYLYRIKSLDPKLKVETGLKLVDTAKDEVLPPPVDLFALPEDHKITLSWDKEAYESIYTAYRVEKSEDSVNFYSANGGLPFMNFNQEGSSNKQMFFTDSVAKNYKPYYYRVIGVSSFGETSPPSKVLSVKGVEKLTTIPKILSNKIEPSGDVILHWEFDKEAKKQIKGFSIDWAPKAEGPYTTIKAGIPNHHRSTTIQKVEASNYYKINALGISHQKTTSLMHFVQPIDSIPPNAPVGLTGTIDSLGIVSLSWQANIEKDIRGYIVRKANLETEKTIPVTTRVITSTTFVDTIQVKSLNASVFYQVVALDKRYNISDFSEKIELKKPDIIPPISPVFEDYKITEKGISLHWLNSSSYDVVSHHLYRKELTEKEDAWQRIFTTDTIAQYTDADVTSGAQYRYSIFAEDDSQLQSEPSTPLTITANLVGHSEIIKGFSAIADRENKNITISWRKMPDHVAEILVYRSKNEDKPMLWKQIPFGINKLVDTRINPDNTYTYILKTIFDKGIIPQTKTIEVTY